MCLPAFLTSAAVVCCGVGVRRILLLGYGGESHSGTLLALSPSCQVVPAVFLLFVLTHTPCQRGHVSLAYSPCVHFSQPSLPSHTCTLFANMLTPLVLLLPLPSLASHLASHLLVFIPLSFFRLHVSIFPLYVFVSPVSLVLSIALSLYRCSCTVPVPSGSPPLRSPMPSGRPRPLVPGPPVPATQRSFL